MKAKNYTIVSDPGIDDIIALLLFYKLSSSSKNTLISSFGNTKEEYTSKNAKEFISLIAKNWSFMHGSKCPVKPVKFKWPTYFHGKDGIWDIHTNSKNNNIKETESYPKNKYLISLAPLTDTLKVINSTKTTKELLVMGGAFDVGGNETKYAETNIFLDPYAANKVVKNKKIKIKIVPLDVTRKVFWTKKECLSFPDDTEDKKWVKGILLKWFEKYGDKKNMNFELHDPLTIFLSFYPEFAKWKTCGVSVEIRGIRKGQTVFEKSGGNCRVVVDLKKPEEISKKIYEIIFE